MALPPDFAPGTQWSYSNTGYALLGIIADKACGKFYGDFLKERVFSPLGMEGARIISEKDIVKNRAAGYTLEKGELKNQDWVSPSLNSTADGSLYFSVLDVAKWDAALRAGKLLKPESYAALWTPVRLADGTSYPYGFGWGFDEQRGEKVIEHGGSWQGFRTAITSYMDKKLTVIVLANLAQAQPESVATAIAGIVEPSLALPEVRSGAADPDPATTAALRGVLEDWGKGVVSPRMAKGLSGTHAGTAREKVQRERTAATLAKAKGFFYLAGDDVAGKAIERRGEVVSRASVCRPNDRPRRSSKLTHLCSPKVDHPRSVPGSELRGGLGAGPGGPRGAPLALRPKAGVQSAVVRIVVPAALARAGAVGRF